MPIRTQLLAALFPLLVLSPASPQAHAPADNSKLIYTLIVSRHGVRSPTGKSTQYDRYSKAAWPAWTTAPGELTPHGFALMKIFGSYDRELFSSEGLFSAQDCADATRITIHADSDQRTRETGRALAEGLFPGCSVPVQAKAEGTHDPLFHPANIPPAQAELAAAAILGRIGGDPAAIVAAYHAPLAEFDSLLASCGDAEPGHSRTSLFDIPSTISTGTDDHLAEVKGPLSVAATLTENLLLAYTEGMDMKQVGWGCIDGTRLRSLMDLHTASSEFALRTPAVAGPLSSSLLRVIAASLAQAATGKPVNDAEGRVGDKMLLLVGHDTNLSAIAGALHLDWILDDRRDDTPPGSALELELRQDASGRRTVQLFFTAQTLEQMRNAAPLSLTNPAPRVPVFIPGCSAADGACELGSFEVLLKERMQQAQSTR
ncbi:histidine-type phosphatase [Silvibacterium dinghuense]|uniref:Histidine-type phosphatase n=1 Tax=Silvibacterium dinghuense TaxID=1560006 RepID=A0A4Q1SIN0_9BACT|nr:histidine-type phosphatase [Silvibacterium dinghuense]RXS97265.1 histidine-type phosphatase [Silvibacterium dinghuense]GGG97616.1 phosphoanhydride phosphohydrolase [Silvibacterium dinghuense]